MSDEPLVSIIMPAYNSERFIAESIESVIVQTYTNWELIIIDDGSTDNTGKIIKQYAQKDNRIKSIYQRNQKQGKARNTGLENSKGELIAFLDSDDLWIPEKLKIQVSFLANNEVDLLYSNGYVFSNNLGNLTGRLHMQIGFFQGDLAIKRLLESNFIPILSVLTKRQAILEVGGFDEDLHIQNIEDYHLWLKMILNGCLIYGMPDSLVYYRQHESQVTAIESAAAKKIFLMLNSNLNIPTRLTTALNKSKLIWGRSWYNTASDKKSALEILNTLKEIPRIKNIALLTKISLLIIGVNFSKKILNKSTTLLIYKLM